MKRIIFFLAIFFSLSKVSLSEIVYIDIDLIVAKSKPGADITIQLDKLRKSNTEEFKKIETKLKSEEEKIVSQKNKPHIEIKQKC